MPIVCNRISKGIKLRALSSAARIVAAHVQFLGLSSLSLSDIDTWSTSSWSLSRLEARGDLTIKGNLFSCTSSSFTFWCSFSCFSYFVDPVFDDDYVGFFLSNLVSRPGASNLVSRTADGASYDGVSIRPCLFVMVTLTLTSKSSLSSSPWRILWPDAASFFFSFFFAFLSSLGKMPSSI